VCTAGLGSLLALAGCGGGASDAGRGQSTFDQPTASSAQLAPPKTQLFRGDRFSLTIPGTPELSTKTIKTAVGKVTLHNAYVSVSPTTGFGIGYGDYPRGSGFDLEFAVAGAAQQAGGRATDIKHIRYRGVAGRDFRIVGKLNGFALFERILFVGRRIYTFSAAVKNGGRTPPAAFSSMLESFRF
jgi:hypothetical protein